jgi:hypothetical protein
MQNFTLDRTDGFSLPNAYYMAQISKAAYENEAKFKAEMNSLFGYDPTVTFYDNKKTHTQAYLVETNDNDVIVVFRGTEFKNFKDVVFNQETLSDVMTDIDIRKTDVHIDGKVAGKAHCGFIYAVKTVFSSVTFENRDNKQQPSIMPDLKTILKKNPEKKIWFTGHSLGAALSTLAIIKFYNKGYDSSVKGLYTFGSPRCLDSQLADCFNTKFNSKAFRVVNKRDGVTRIPVKLPAKFLESFDITSWKHIGKEIYITHNDKFIESPHLLDVTKDRMLSKAQSFFCHGDCFDSVNDHDMTNYIEAIYHDLTRKNIQITTQNDDPAYQLT